jgi:cytochrome c oxidase cbb3-type subunit 3
MHARRSRIRWTPGAAAALPLLLATAVAFAQQQTTRPQVSPEDAKGRETLLRVCATCHPIERVTAEGRSRSQWENTIIAMQTARGAIVTPEDFAIVLEYLTKFHGRDSTAGVSAPMAGAGGRGGAARGPRANVGAADRHRVDAAGAVRGQALYAAQCVTCHGANARGTERGANLIRSPRVLRDRYGNALGPYLTAGHPTQTGTGAALTREQITDLSHFLWDRINNTLRGSPDFDVKDVLSGDPAAGRAYFEGEGGCTRCHSAAGDLAGYGRRFPPVDIQQRFVFPSAGGGRGRGAPPRPRVKATVTVPGSPPVSGTLVSIDDFHVALRDEAGQYRSWRRTPEIAIVKDDPFAFHVDLLDRLTDKAMHDVVAYLESLK